LSCLSLTPLSARPKPIGRWIPAVALDAGGLFSFPPLAVPGRWFPLISVPLLHLFSGRIDFPSKDEEEGPLSLFASVPFLLFRPAFMVCRMFPRPFFSLIREVSASFPATDGGASRFLFRLCPFPVRKRISRGFVFFPAASTAMRRFFPRSRQRKTFFLDPFPIVKVAFGHGDGNTGFSISWIQVFFFGAFLFL